MIEVLSPAGTYESFRAAITAGADAVYLGGSMFGARAFAGNFNEKELIQAIEYAHICNRKVYLTVNTLLKEDELEKRLYDYLCPYYEKGLDAVIVQDFGVFRFIKRNFPDMDIHASTQMTISGHLGASLLASLGASRVVTPRELTLSEIAKIRKENPKLEIESFVHGALCYCYSGQCLMSSLIGGRSGNRGRCAQSCRLPYDVYCDGIKKNGREQFLLSPKDMCALENLPQVIEAGVNSLKIEGRMKSPEYTAGVVSMYRKYVDMYLQCGKENYLIDSKDIEKLMDLYNRGNFTKGYYTEAPGKAMMSMERPNHQGVALLKVVESSKGNFSAKPLTVVYAGDVVEIAPDYEITIGAKDVASKLLTFRIPAKFSVQKGQILYRTRNQALIEDIRNEYIEKEPKNNVNVHIALYKDVPAMLTIESGETFVTVEGNACTKALNQPVSKEQIERQLSKFGNTLFAAKDIFVEMDEDVFIPMGAINELRRNAVELLEQKLAEKYYRKAKEQQNIEKTEAIPKEQKLECRALISREEQFLPVMECNAVTCVYLDSSLFDGEEWITRVQMLRKNGKKVCFAFPRLFRERFEKNITAMLPIIKQCKFDGYLVRSLCEIGFLKKNHLSGEIISDHNLYVWNREAIAFLSEQGADTLTVPVELNEREIRAMNPSGMEMIAYGYYPMMISAQCVRKNVEGCKKGTAEEKKVWQLLDRKKNTLPVVSDCKNCLTTIYNVAPVDLMEHFEEFEKLGMSTVRLEFTIEDAKATKEVLNRLNSVNKGDNNVSGRVTNGHFTRGVE